MERRNSLVAAINAQARGKLEVIGENAGLSLVALLPPGVDDAKVVARARQAGIGANALSRCFVSTPVRGGVLLGYANLEPKDVPRMIRFLSASVDVHRT